MTVERESKGARLAARRAVTGAAITAVGVAGIAALAIGGAKGGATAAADLSRALLGEARKGAVTVEIAPAVADIAVTEAKAPGRPIVVLDPGHGGRDPGAVGISGATAEKVLTLALARELRDRLAQRGRVRVALTRDGDRYLTLEQRASVARSLGASLYLSLHIDSAPNPLARGATAYSLSDVASDPDSARLAVRENGNPASTEPDGSVRALLSDLALRDQMNASAQLAERLVRQSRQRILLRPEPHRFAAFHVLRRAEVPAVLFEAGYISNAEDEAMLTSPEYRARLVEALAQAIEADVASRMIG